MTEPQSGSMAAWDAPEFRLAGYGGAALFVRSQVIPGKAFGLPGVSTAYDVMLLAPDYHVWYLGRRANEHFVDWLSSFLFAAAADLMPESTVLPFDDSVLGMSIRALGSTDERVRLEVRFVADREDRAAGPDVLDFETSRYALAVAAESVRFLDPRWGGSGLDAELES